MSTESQVLPPLFSLITQLHDEAGTIPAHLNSTLAELTEAAKDTGFSLFSLRRYKKARFHLTIAGAAGDVDAQYTMATCQSVLDGGGRRPTSATRQWLSLAAAQDHIPALMRLGDVHSLAKAKELATQAANNNAPRAMIYLYLMTQDIEWLNRAAATGAPEALFELAQAYRKRPALIANTLQREATVAQLIQRSADGGHRAAVYELAFAEDGTVSTEQKQKRIIQLAEMGQLDGLLEYGYALAGLSQDKAKTHRTYGLERNLPKACALLRLVLIETADAMALPNIEADYWALMHQMSDTQDYQAILADLQETTPKLFSVLEPMVLVGLPD
ncbi:tetratricopeptide repeat protein [Pseudomonas sp. MF7453]|uniref:tetratricopeptide repeat protein n=1 Tax=Pseudomonas sp. MF7453 TaxID=2797539 RepID=UPI0018E81ED0|nr:sel1 repeat family protein [Pseudomonas sp. MF7453]MBJ2220314.1 sel1 repeat family protein [Pseudomonas sp. MF7453]